MKKLLLILTVFISLKVSGQINAVNDTTRITASPTFSPQFVPNIFNSGGVNYRVTYVYNPSTQKYDAVVYSKYLRRFYLSKADSLNFINQIFSTGRSPKGTWNFANDVNISGITNLNATYTNAEFHFYQPNGYINFENTSDHTNDWSIGQGGLQQINFNKTTSPSDVRTLSYDHTSDRLHFKYTTPSTADNTLAYISDLSSAPVSTAQQDSLNKKQDTLGTNGPATITYGALRPIYDTVSHTNTWSFVLDALHKPSAAITSVSSTSTYVQVNYGPFARIHLGSITNDEALAKLGVFAGTSVGADNTKIFIYQQLNDYVIATYSTSTSSWTFTGTNTAGASMAFSGTLHYLTFTNTAWPQSQNMTVKMVSSDTDLTHDTNKYLAADVAYPSTTSVRFRLLKLTGDYLPALVDGLQLKFTFSGIVQVNPTTYAFANLPNFWFYGIFGR